MANFKVTQPRTVNEFKQVAKEVLFRYEKNQDSSILLKALQDLSIGKFGDHSTNIQSQLFSVGFVVSELSACHVGCLTGLPVLTA